MKVVSFVVGLAKKVEGAFATLDERVAELGAVTIHSVVDTFYPEMPQTEGGLGHDERIVRVVIYTPRKRR